MSIDKKTIEVALLKGERVTLGVQKSPIECAS